MCTQIKLSDSQLLEMLYDIIPSSSEKPTIRIDHDRYGLQRHVYFKEKIIFTRPNTNILTSSDIQVMVHAILGRHISVTIKKEKRLFAKRKMVYLGNEIIYQKIKNRNLD